MTTPENWDAEVNNRAAQFAQNIRPQCLRCGDTGRIYAGGGSYETRDDDQPCPDCSMVGWV